VEDLIDWRGPKDNAVGCGKQTIDESRRYHSKPLPAGSPHCERAPRSWQDVAAPATVWSELVCGRQMHPLKSSGFHGAFYRQSRNPSSAIAGTSPFTVNFLEDQRRTLTAE
jgi:hypothetical protein